MLGKPATSSCVPKISTGTKSEAAPIRRHAGIAVQFRFLRTIAPVELLVGSERRRALQLVIVDVEFVGFEPGVVAKPAPGQRKQIGSHAEEPAETRDRVSYLPGNLATVQPFEVANH